MVLFALTKSNQNLSHRGKQSKNAVVFHIKEGEKGGHSKSPRVNCWVIGNELNVSVECSGCGKSSTNKLDQSDGWLHSFKKQTRQRTVVCQPERDPKLCNLESKH